MTLLSVIIPVYNTAEFLHQCVNSVIEQADMNCTEIILVNDGSTDNSPEICREFEGKYSNINCINKENEGLAAARNTGIEKALGEYILFVDSDDYLLSDSAHSLITLCEKAHEKSIDALCFNYTRKGSHEAERKCAKSYSNDISMLVNSNIYTSSACLKLFKKKMLIDNNIFFVKGTLSEDILFCGKILDVKNVKIEFYNAVLYFYRVRNNSISRNVSKRQILDVVSTIEELVKTNSENVLSYVAFQYATLMININLCKEQIDNNTLEKICNKKDVLKYNTSFTVRIIYVLTKIFGAKTASNMLCFAFKQKNR